MHWLLVAEAACLQLQVSWRQGGKHALCAAAPRKLTGVLIEPALPADAADKAAADGVEQLSLGQKAKAFLKALQPAYWQALAVVSLLYFARFDASFITLRARTVGRNLRAAPLVLLEHFSWGSLPASVLSFRARAPPLWGQATGNSIRVYAHANTAS